MVGDATGTTILYLPKEKVLIAGDAVAYPIPGFNFNLPVSQMLKTLKRLAAFDADVVIPTATASQFAIKGLPVFFSELFFQSVIDQTYCYELTFNCDR